MGFISESQMRKRYGKRYLALLSQAGTAAPTARVLDNAIGNIVWGRTGAGVYTATLVGAFTANKTFLRGRVYDQATGKALVGVRTSADVITFTNGIVAGAASDVINNIEVEITVYE